MFTMTDEEKRKIKREIKVVIKKAWLKTPRPTKQEFLALVEAAWCDQVQNEYDM